MSVSPFRALRSLEAWSLESWRLQEEDSTRAAERSRFPALLGQTRLALRQKRPALLLEALLLARP